MKRYFIGEVIYCCYGLKYRLIILWIGIEYGCIKKVEIVNVIY